MPVSYAARDGLMEPGTAEQSEIPQPRATPPPAVSQSAPPKARRLSGVHWAVIAIVVIVIVVVATVVVLRARAENGATGPEVLIPGRTLTNLSAGQLAAVNFIVQSPSVLNGTYATYFSTTFYVLTPDEYSTFLLHSVITGYEWTNSTDGFVGYAQLEVKIPAGQWVFTMINTNLTQSSGVGWITPLTLSPG